MGNEAELLKIIGQLKNELKDLKDKNGKLEVELYETNKKLNEALLALANYQEKKKSKEPEHLFLKVKSLMIS